MGFEDEGFVDEFSGESWKEKPGDCPTIMDPDNEACKGCQKKGPCMMEMQARLSGKILKEMDERDAQDKRMEEAGRKVYRTMNAPRIRLRRRRVRDREAMEDFAAIVNDFADVMREKVNISPLEDHSILDMFALYIQSFPNVFMMVEEMKPMTPEEAALQADVERELAKQLDECQGPFATVEGGLMDTGDGEASLLDQGNGAPGVGGQIEPGDIEEGT